MTGLDLLGPDSSTVLWAFHDPSGVANGGVRTKLATALDLGTPGEDPDLFTADTDGAFRLGGRVDPVEMTIPFMAWGASYSVLARGLGQLSRWLHEPVGYLRWLEDGVTLYITPLGCLSFPSLLRGQSLAGIVPRRANSLGPLSIRILRQPWMEGPEITSATFTVPMDPASSNKVRTLPVNIGGDLPTPVRVKSQVGGPAAITLATSAAADDIVDTAATHPFTFGDAIQFLTLTGGSGLTTGTVYYVTSTSLGATTFRPSATQGGTPINFTTDITAGTVAFAGRVGKVHMGARSQGAKPSTVLSQYLSDFGFLTLGATNRNWTVTLSNGTTNSSGVAVVDHNTNPSLMLPRVTATRTTALDSGRGDWRVFLRLQKNVSPGNFYVEGRYGFATTASADHSMGTEVNFKDNGSATAEGDRPCLVELGTMKIPTDLTVPVTSLRVELWTRLEGGGTDDLNLAHLWFMPANESGSVVVPGSEETTYLGSTLVTPSGITADPGWTAGADVGTARRLNANTEAAGTQPNSGAVRTVGRHRVTFRTRGNAFTGNTRKYRITNETDNTEIAASSVTAKLLGESVTTLEYEALAAKSYLYGVYITAYGGSGSLDVLSITDEVIASVGTDQYIRTDPGRVTAEALDSSGNVIGGLDIEGSVVAFMEPGPGHIMLASLEVPQTGFEDFEDLEDRVLTCVETHRERYSL